MTLLRLLEVACSYDTRLNITYGEGGGNNKVVLVDSTGYLEAPQLLVATSVKLHYMMVLATMQIDVVLSGVTNAPSLAVMSLVVMSIIHLRKAPREVYYNNGHLSDDCGRAPL